MIYVTLPGDFVGFSQNLQESDIAIDIRPFIDGWGYHVRNQIIKEFFRGNEFRYWEDVRSLFLPSIYRKLSD